MQSDDVDDMNVENFTETKSHRGARGKILKKELYPAWGPALCLSALGGLLVAATVGWKLAAKHRNKKTHGSEEG